MKREAAGRAKAQNDYLEEREEMNGLRHLVGLRSGTEAHMREAEEQ